MSPLLLCINTVRARCKSNSITNQFDNNKRFAVYLVSMFGQTDSKPLHSTKEAPKASRYTYILDAMLYSSNAADSEIT